MRYRIVVFAVLLAACSIIEPIAPELITPGLAQRRAAEIVSTCAGVQLEARLIRRLQPRFNRVGVRAENRAALPGEE